MSDYILDKLHEKQSLYETLSNEKRHFIALMKREYLIRLMLAVLWDEYYSKCNSSENREVVGLVLEKKPSLGDFTRAMAILCKYSPEKSMYTKICKLTNEKVIFNRNQYDHKISSEVDKMIKVIDNWICEIEKMDFHLFSYKTSRPYEYSFLVPYKKTNNNHVLCICFGKENKITTPFKDLRIFQREINEQINYLGQLYYYIEECSSGKIEIYKLSPFIHYFGDPAQPVFTLYNSTISKSTVLITNARSLFDEQLDNEDPNDILSKHSCRHEFELRDVSRNYETENFYASQYNNVMVNKSGYQNFQLAANNQYKYSESIVQDYCNKVYSFCREKKSQMFIIVGGGGLGKTALLLNIIQKFMRNDHVLKKAKYDLIIFLSAKQNYLVDENDRKMQIDISTPSDITDFESFRYKLWKYVFDLNGEEMKERNGIGQIEEIENQEKTILLMIDDFDMLVPKDQEKIQDFITSISPAKMKTIISTRNMNTNGTKMEIKRFDQEKCIEFARWLIETDWKNEGKLWLYKLNEEVYQRNVFELSRGIPVFIKKWVQMFVHGINCLNMDNVFTERDCIKYLYCTISNQLNTKDAQMIYIIKKICNLCSIKIFDPFFLFIISSVETERERDQCLKTLICAQLIQDNGNDTYSLFDFDYSYIEISDEKYYDSQIYQLIFDDMSKCPDIWRKPLRYIIDELIHCLETISEHDHSSALLLDKLCSDYGKRYCSGIQSERLLELQSTRVFANSMNAEIAVIMGVWDGKSYEISLLEKVLSQIKNAAVDEVLIAILTKVVECCDEKVDNIFEREEETESYFKEYLRIWNIMNQIPNISDEVENLKRNFKQRLQQLEDA